MNLPKPRYEVTADEKHRYTIKKSDGSVIGPLKSVTKCVGVLDKPALIHWAAREASGYFKAELLRIGNLGKLRPEDLEAIAEAAKNAHRRKATDAADLGTKCHDIFQAILIGKEPEEIPTELAEPTLDFKRWRMGTDIEIVATELALGSELFRFGGRTDAIGYSEKRGGFGIVDYKTSSGFYGNEYAYQCGGYAVAFEEMYGIPVSWAEIVRFGKKPPYDSEARPVADLNAARKAFLKLVDIVEAHELALIGAPSFSTAEERAKDAPKANGKKPADAKKKAPVSAGF